MTVAGPTIVTSPEERRSCRSLLLVGVLLYAGWALQYADTGRLSDDGLHAYAARALLHGHQLYRDFEYHQGPLLPLLLRAWYRVAGVGFVQARALALLLSLAVFGLTFQVAKLAGADALRRGWMALALAFSPSVALHLGYVQPHALATLLALLALLATLRGGTAWPLVGWCLAALATATRVSFVVVLLPLAWHARRVGGKALPAGLAVAAATLVVVLAPYAAGGHLQQALYLPTLGGVNDFTRSYLGLYLPTHGLGDALWRRLASWPNQLSYYGPLWLLVVVAATRRDRDRESGEGPLLLVLTALALTAAHGLLPRRVNHSYLVVAMPFWGAAAAAWPRSGAPLRAGRALLLSLLFVVAPVAAVSRGLGRLDHSGGRTALAEIRDVANELRARTAPGDEVFSFALEFLVQADRDVTPGLELGYFAYYPNLSRAQALQHHVVNHELLLDTLEERRPDALLLHDGALEPIAPTSYPWPDSGDLWAAAKAGYEPVRTWRDVGEKQTGLTLWLRRGG